MPALDTHAMPTQSNGVTVGQPVLTAGEPTGAPAGQVVRGRGWTGWKDGGCRKSAKDWTW